MKIVREELYPKYTYPSAKARREAWIERSARKKAELAEKLDSNQMLVAAIRFYTGHLTAEPVNVDEMLANHRQMTRKWQRHLKAARLVLGVESQKDDRHCVCFRLPRNWQRRVLERIGLPLIHPAELENFEQLSTNLLIDARLGRYSDAHPVLERAKDYLRGWTHSAYATINDLPADIPPPVIEPVMPPPAATSSFWHREIKRRLIGMQ
jgi:hypothetical protein